MKILIKESVLRQALAALDRMKKYGDVFLCKAYEEKPYDQVCTATTALRTALDAAEKVEPVAWMYSEDTRGGTGVISFERLSHYSNETPLYTHPAPCAGRREVMTEHICPSCHCLFKQEFLCTTCGAEKLKDEATKQLERALHSKAEALMAQTNEIERLRKERDECLQTIARLDEANPCMHTELAALCQKIDALEPVAWMDKKMGYIGDYKKFDSDIPLFDLKGIK